MKVQDIFKKMSYKYKKRLTTIICGAIMKLSKKDKLKGGGNLNKLRLESVMRLHGDTGTSLAKTLDISRTTFSAKINETNGAEFTQGEIAVIIEKYSLSPDDVVEIFFDSKLS